MSEPRGTPLTLRPIDRLALQWLAAQDHHQYMSVAARKVIAEGMVVRLGENWEEKVTQLMAPSEELAFAS